jgi:hypothetical protein
MNNADQSIRWFAFFLIKFIFFNLFVKKLDQQETLYAIVLIAFFISYK